MKAAAAILGALAGLLIVGLGAYFVFGLKNRPAVPTANVPPAQAADTGPGTPHPGVAVDVPLSREEKLRDELNAKRLPLYRYLRQNYGDLIERFSVLEDYDTLDLVVKQADEKTLTALVQQAIAPSAKEYGFRRVRFYTRNAPNAVDPFTVVAESSEDGSGRWNTFMK
jgi:hypothetical protein